MNIITKNLCREIAKCSIDLFKIAFAAAFISPWIASEKLEISVTLWSAIMTASFFLFGMIMHRIADHMDGQD